MKDMSLERDVIKESLDKVIDSAKHPYLGELGTVRAVLQEALGEAMAAGADVEAIAKRTAEVFLGRNETYVPANKWNEPGGIDVFLAEHCAVDESDPLLRVAGAVAEMVIEALEIAEFAADENVAPSMWTWRVDDLLDRYAKLFVGVHPATDIAMPF